METRERDRRSALHAGADLAPLAQEDGAGLRPWSVRWTLIQVVLFAVYVLAGKFGLNVAFLHASASPVWAPTGIALAAVLLYGPRVWPAIALGAFVVNVTTQGTILTSTGVALGNTLEALVGGRLATRYANGARAFLHPSDVFRFALFAGILATTISATLGVTSLGLGGFVPWEAFGAVWSTWWLGDLCGALIVTPALVLVAGEPRPGWSKDQLLEGLLLLATLMLAAQIVFGVFWRPRAVERSLEFLCIPPLLWAAFRFGPRETACAAILLSALAIETTLDGFGPFVRPSPNESLLILQSFMAITTLMALAVAASVRERRVADRRVQRLNDRLEQLVLERTEALQSAYRELSAEVAERQRAEAERLQFAEEQAARRQAEEANRLKDEFLAVLSHELRTPLSAILAWASLLKDGLDAETSDKALDTILRNAKIQSQLISDILDVSRIISGRVTLELEDVELRHPVEAALDTLGPMAQARGVELQVSFEKLGRPVRSDPARIQQIVWNLVSNAIKFCPETGGRVEVQVRARDGSAELTVQDNGRGIDPEFLPHAFDRFRQADSTTTRKHGGLGLGLAIARHLVELHGGSISAVNRADRTGAVFTVLLPFSESDAQPALRGAARTEGLPEISLSGTTVLVVDDEADAREAVGALLERWGAHTLRAGTVDEALQSCERHVPDFVLTDLAMPHEDGYSLLRRLRTLPRSCGGDWRIVALTAHASSEDRRKALAAGFDAYLTKPFQPRDLARVLAFVRARSERRGG